VTTPKQRLGPYRLLARIGRGGMAEVFVAERFGASGFVKRFAVKALLPELAGEAELQRRLVAEAKLGARLGHRNLVTVVDLGVDDGRYYLVMEYVDGVDLRRALAAGRPPLGVALHLVDEIAAGLEYLHGVVDDDGRALGLVHRDVSPGNVLLSRSGEVKLADLGIAKATHLASETAARIVRGTFAYLAPERLVGAADDQRSDQFALGVVLVELGLGRAPFGDDDGVEAMSRARRGAAPELAGLPDDVAQLARRCLAVDPDARFPDITALREALQAVRAGHGPGDCARLARWIAGSRVT
jgi:eukaryotic-like serine/threonine-protein kinase